MTAIFAGSTKTPAVGVSGKPTRLWGRIVERTRKIGCYESGTASRHETFIENKENAKFVIPESNGSPQEGVAAANGGVLRDLA